VCILRDLPKEKNPTAFCARGAPPIIYVPMFPWKYFFSTKRGKMEGKKKGQK
jgi:hypothetical protein